jgi:glutamyl/glutaminyl-tRNA synthetase
MDITHVIRGEDHLNNTVRQLMIYEALNAKVPVFCHVSLLIGHDRQKLSKRHGATSVNLYRNEHYLPEAMCNYLTLLGWSHPDEKDIFHKEELFNIFKLDRFSAHAAMYDLEKLKWVNGQHLRSMANPEIIKMVYDLEDNEFFKLQSDDWRNCAVELIKHKVNFIPEFPKMIQDLMLNEHLEMTNELMDILNWETTPKIISYLYDEVSKCHSLFITENELNGWMDFVKKELGIKGKQLFQGVRAALTGVDHGPELKILIPLTPVAVIKRRLEQLKR